MQFSYGSNSLSSSLTGQDFDLAAKIIEWNLPSYSFWTELLTESSWDFTSTYSPTNDETTFGNLSPFKDLFEKAYNHQVFLKLDSKKFFMSNINRALFINQFLEVFERDNWLNIIINPWVILEFAEFFENPCLQQESWATIESHYESFSPRDLSEWLCTDSPMFDVIDWLKTRDTEVAVNGLIFSGLFLLDESPLLYISYYITQAISNPYYQHVYRQGFRYLELTPFVDRTFHQSALSVDLQPLDSGFHSLDFYLPGNWNVDEILDFWDFEYLV